MEQAKQTTQFSSCKSGILLNWSPTWLQLTRYLGIIDIARLAKIAKIAIYGVEIHDR